MSTVYSMEPRTNCKVNLNTTYGTICVELWGKECPLACRNFIQLCLEGYYDQSLFDRLVPGFCLQTGKPAKLFEDESDKNGMAAIMNGSFPIETHSRLKFNRRGLVGMVALDQDNIKHPNRSQFFFTLSEAPELNGRATLFGRVVGDTIFNLLRMGELEIDTKTESPLYPPQIIDTEVIINPFKDIIPRERTSKCFDKKLLENTSTYSFKKKNLSLLSFTEPEIGVDHGKVGSQNTLHSSAKPQENSHNRLYHIHPSESPSSLQFLQQMKAVQMRETGQKIKSIEKELGLSVGGKCAIETSSKDKSTEYEKGNKTSALEKYKMKIAEGKKRNILIDSKNETETLLILNSFRQKIQKTESASKPENAQVEPPKKHLDICKLHGLLNCLSCKNTFNVNLNTETLDFDEKDWLMHKLVFDRRELEIQVREDLKELVVIDPREQAEKMNTSKFELSKK